MPAPRQDQMIEILGLHRGNNFVTIHGNNHNKYFQATLILKNRCPTNLVNITDSEALEAFEQVEVENG